MIKVDRSTILDVPVARAWSVLRDFNGHDRWHPAIAESRVDHRSPSDKVGCVRRFRLTDGAELTEQLLAQSDLERSYSYCLIETPIPLLNYVAHVRLFEVTDGARTLWRWNSQFTVPPGQEEKLSTLVGDGIYVAGFDAIRSHFQKDNGVARR